MAKPSLFTKSDYHPGKVTEINMVLDKLFKNLKDPAKLPIEELNAITDLSQNWYKRHIKLATNADKKIILISRKETGI